MHNHAETARLHCRPTPTSSDYATIDATIQSRLRGVRSWASEAVAARRSSSRDRRVDHTSRDTISVHSTMPLTWWLTVAAAVSPTHSLRLVLLAMGSMGRAGGGRRHYY